MKPESRENQQGHVRTEKEISESAARYQVLFEKAPISITLVNSAGIITDCNQACERLLGYRKEEIIGKPFQTLMVVDTRDLADVVSKFEKFFRGDDIAPYELEVIKKTGERRWVTIINSLMMKGNKIVGLQVLATDITEKKQAEKLLSESEKKFRDKSLELQIVNEIISYGNTADNLTTFLQKTLAKILQISPSLGGGIYLYNEANKSDILATYESLPQDFIKLIQEVDMAREPYSKMIEKQEPIILNDFIHIFPEAEQWNIQSVIAIPILAKNRYIGNLNIASEVNLPADLAELKFLTLIGKEIGSIIQGFQTEQLLRESEEEYRTLFEEAPYAIVLINLKGKIVDCNSTIERLFGYKKNELIGYKFSDLGIYNPEMVPVLIESFRKKVTEGGVKPLDVPIKKANGESVWVHAHTTLVKIKNENIFQFIVQDITEQKIAEQRLKESEEKYRLISENLNDLILVYSSENNIEYINEETHQRLLGYTKEDLQGTEPLDLIHPEDRDSLVKSFRTAFDNKEISEEVRVKRKDGTYLWVEVKAKTFKDGSGQSKFLNISRDISERRALEETRKSNINYLEHEVEQKTQALRKETEELQKALESLKIAQKYLVQSEKLASIGLLAAGIAHEINNPLMGIINYAQIIRDELETKVKLDLSIKPYSFLDGIIKEGERISEIVEGLLSFAREDKGQFINADISEIINSALALLLPKIKNSQIEIKLEYDSSLPKVPMKTRNIRQVILNVIQNSITALNEKYGSFSRKGDKIITIKTSGLILDDKPYAKISIKDNGTGIRSEDLPKVFDPFYTTKGAKGTKGEGMGLGLSISYGIIKDHNGRIEIQSEWGSWTLLVITLPLEL